MHSDILLESDVVTEDCEISIDIGISDVTLTIYVFMLNDSSVSWAKFSTNNEPSRVICTQNKQEFAVFRENEVIMKFTLNIFFQVASTSNSTFIW